MIHKRTGSRGQRAVAAGDQRNLAIDVMKVFDLERDQTAGRNIVGQHARGRQPDAVCLDDKFAQDVEIVADEAPGRAAEPSNA